MIIVGKPIISAAKAVCKGSLKSPLISPGMLLGVQEPPVV